MDRLEIERLVISSSLITAGVIAIYCPCGNQISGKGFLSCHLKEVTSLIGLASAIIIYANI